MRDRLPLSAFAAFLGVALASKLFADTELTDAIFALFLRLGLGEPTADLTARLAAVSSVLACALAAVLRVWS